MVVSSWLVNQPVVSPMSLEEGDGGQPAAHGEQAGLEELEEEAQVDHFPSPPFRGPESWASSTPVTPASTTRVTGEASTSSAFPRRGVRRQAQQAAQLGQDQHRQKNAHRRGVFQGALAQLEDADGDEGHHGGVDASQGVLHHRNFREVGEEGGDEGDERAISE